MWLRILKANAAYAVGSAANSAALLLLVPFLANRLSVVDYGVWSLFEVGIVLLNMLMLAGVDVGLMREHWSLESEDERRELGGTVALTVLAWSVALSCVLAVIGYAVAAGFPGLGIDASVRRAALAALGTGCMEALFAVLLSVFRIRDRAPTFVALAVGRMFACLILTVIAVEAGGGVAGALLGRAGASILGVLAALIVVRASIRFSWRWQPLKRVLRYGLPLLPAGLAGYVLLAADRYVLQRVATLEVVACYSFAYKIAAVLDTVVTRPFGLDWAPRRFRIATEPDAAAKYNAALLYYVAISCAAMLGLMACAPSVYVWLVPHAYASGQSVVPVLLAAYFVVGLSVPLNVGIMLKDKTRYLPRIAWCAALVCACLNLWWIPRYGMAGAAWATLVANATLTIGIAWISQRFYVIAYAWGFVAWIVAITAAGVVGLWIIETSWTIQSELLGLLARLTWVAGVCGLIGFRLWRGLRVGLQRGELAA